MLIIYYISFPFQNSMMPLDTIAKVAARGWLLDQCYPEGVISLWWLSQCYQGCWLSTGRLHNGDPRCGHGRGPGCEKVSLTMAHKSSFLINRYTRLLPWIAM